MQTQSSGLTPTKNGQKGWKLPLIMCPCTSDDQTPDTIINKICIHPDCKENLLFCNECINNALHEQLHSSQIFKVKDFLSECLKVYQSFKEDEFSYQEFTPDVLQLHVEKDKLLTDYKGKLQKQMDSVNKLFDDILQEVKALLNDRRDKLVGYLKKTYEVCEMTFNLFSQKVNNYNENWEFFKSNNFVIDQTILNEQLSQVKDSKEFNDFLTKLNLVKNKLTTIGDDNFTNIIYMSRVLRKYLESVPEMRSLSETKTKKYPLLDSLELKDHMISAHKRITFSNNEYFQGLCTDMMQCLDSEDQEIVSKMRNSFFEFEYFLNENKKSEDFAVTQTNHFTQNCIRPFLHYFHFNTKDLYLLYLPNNGQKLSPEDCVFQRYALDIDFNLPTNHASISTPDGRLFLNGGKSNLDKMYEIEFENKRLIPRKSMKQRRWDHAICLVKGQIYVLGGADREENYRLTKKCERYDITLDAWTDISSFTTEASDFSVCGFNDRYIYKFGGWNSVSYINIIERYDIEFDQWTVINPPLKPMLGGFPECIQINERQIYVFGGFYIKGHDENFILEVEENNEQDDWASNYGMEKIKFANKLVFPVRSQFKMPKNVLIHNSVVYTIYKNKEQSCLLAFDGKRWKILNDNIYLNYNISNE